MFVTKWVIGCQRIVSLKFLFETLKTEVTPKNSCRSHVPTLSKALCLCVQTLLQLWPVGSMNGAPLPVILVEPSMNSSQVRNWSQDTHRFSSLYTYTNTSICCVLYCLQIFKAYNHLQNIPIYIGPLSVQNFYSFTTDNVSVLLALLLRQLYRIIAAHFNSVRRKVSVLYKDSVSIGQ